MCAHLEAKVCRMNYITAEWMPQDNPRHLQVLEHNDMQVSSPYGPAGISNGTAREFRLGTWW